MDAPLLVTNGAEEMTFRRAFTNRVTVYLRGTLLGAIFGGVFNYYVAVAAVFNYYVAVATLQNPHLPSLCIFTVLESDMW